MELLLLRVCFFLVGGQMHDAITAVRVILRGLDRDRGRVVLRTCIES